MMCMREDDLNNKWESGENENENASNKEIKIIIKWAPLTNSH